MIFRCTTKVQKKLHLTPDRLKDVGPNPAMTEWYCNLVTIEHRQFYLFAHAISLFGCWVPVTSICKSSPFRAAFGEHLVLAMRAWGFSRDDAGRITDDGPDVFAKPRDRGIVGSIVDYAKMCKMSAEYEGGLNLLGLAAMNKIVSEAPMSVLGFGIPHEVLAQLLHPGNAAVIRTDVE